MAPRVERRATPRLEKNYQIFCRSRGRSGLGFYAPKRVIDHLSNITMRKSIQTLREVTEKGLIK